MPTPLRQKTNENQTVLEDLWPKETMKHSPITRVTNNFQSHCQKSSHFQLSPALCQSTTALSGHHCNSVKPPWGAHQVTKAGAFATPLNLRIQRWPTHWKVPKSSIAFQQCLQDAFLKTSVHLIHHKENFSNHQFVEFYPWFINLWVEPMYLVNQVHLVIDCFQPHNLEERPNPASENTATKDFDL